MSTAQFTKISLTLLTSFGMLACASTVHKVDLPAGSDPLAQLSETAERLNTDRAKQYDQLSPRHFSAAMEALDAAHKKSEQDEPAQDVLNEVGKAMAELEIVELNGQNHSASLKSILDARAAAQLAGAQTTLPKESASADKQLKSFGKDIEKGEFTAEATKISKLEGRYTSLELGAIKATQLGGVRSLIEKSENDGAKKLAPRSFNAAMVQADSAARAIEASRNNPADYQAAVAAAVQSSQKLDQIMRTIADSKTSETAAVQIYDQGQMLSANRASLAKAETKAKDAQSVADLNAAVARSKQNAAQANINALEGENQQYADKEALNNKIASVKASFAPEEADVVRDGSKIIIRLKTMKFATARYELTSSSLETLNKVKDMINAVPVSMVTVEGHTDSVGGKVKNLELSQKRAESVKKYFVAEKTLPENQFESKGYGYERPLTSNKTAAGRSTNRRVDIVINTITTL